MSPPIVLLNSVDLSNTCKQSDTLGLPQCTSVPFSQINIESLLDGILLLTPTGNVLSTNQLASQVCTKLLATQSQITPIPKVVWHLCKPLVAHPPKLNTITESEISTDQFPRLYIRAQWVNLESLNEPCVLVILQNRYETCQRLAMAEARQYGLTPRETDVWQLRRMGHSNREIAHNLFISINTVKKHLKNITAKRERERSLISA
ncbi:MAG: helix-turn-helix transcriptional regulator [Cyanobacteria bacterium J06635_15]